MMLVMSRQPATAELKLGDPNLSEPICSSPLGVVVCLPACDCSCGRVRMRMFMCVWASAIVRVQCESLS